MKIIALITFPMIIYSLLAYFYPSPFFNLVPVFRADDCRLVQYDEEIDIFKYEKTINYIVFLFVNWLELAYLYFTWLKLKGVR